LSGNFSFLAEPFPVLEKTGSLAELYLYADANACLSKIATLAETIVNYIFEFESLAPPSGANNTHADRVKALQQGKVLPDDIGNILYVMSIKRDEAVHEGSDSFEDCRSLIEMSHTLSVWFMQAYGDSEYEPAPFVMPDDTRGQANQQELLGENERLSAELEKAQAAAMEKPVHSGVRDSERRNNADRENRRARLSERESRYIIDVLIDEDGNRAKREQTALKKTFRRFQLETMGFVAIFIGPLVLFTTSITYGLAFPQSISETGTIANRAGPILPFCLGALALFALTYAIVHAYDKMDKIFTFGMAAGFTVVAMQMCSSEYINLARVGLLGVSPETSHTIHIIGAIAGFGSMILWVMLCFRKSDKRKGQRTKEKNTRNNVYFYFGLAMLLSLGLFVLDSAGVFGEGFPVVFVAECAMLLFGGIACLIKGGLVLADKE